MLSTDVKSAMAVQKKRAIREQQVKDKILKSAKEKINNYATHGQMKCLYNVPIFLVGHAPYDEIEMIVYVASILMKEGFYIEVDNTNILISWDVRDIQKVQKTKKKSREKMDSLIGMMNLKK
jgi:hypothetical protein